MRPLLLGLLLLAACASTPADGSAPAGNFAEVAPGVYRGAQPDSAGFCALKEMGVRTVVNLRSTHDDEAAAAAGLDVVAIPMPSFPKIDAPTEDEVRTFLDVATDPARLPVFVHCAHGKDRTGTMCALYRIEVEGWTPERAVAEMHEFGYHDWIYGELEEFVLAYRPRGLWRPASAAR
jgi:protein tyrosine/serine phosphatase